MTKLGRTYKVRLDGRALGTDYARYQNCVGVLMEATPRHDDYILRFGPAGTGAEQASFRLADLQVTDDPIRAPEPYRE